MKRYFRFTCVFIAIGLLLSLFAASIPVRAADVTDGLDVKIIAGYNLVVDSNVTAPSTYAPRVATVIGEFCNTSASTINNVVGYIGNHTSLTPGAYPARAPGSGTFNTEHPDLVDGGGSYAFMHLGGAADATRYIGSLAPDTCSYQYWHFTYPACENVGGSPDQPHCQNDPVWGATNSDTDDLWLTFDIWGTSSASTNDNETWKMTMRNEISAMANKIEPNGNPGGTWFNTDTSTINPGETVVTNGILYRLGNVNQGFDNDSDGIPDYNAWLQPFGDASYDPSCFRLVETTGVLTVTTSAGDVIIPFANNLYFTDLPQNNTNVVGLVYYKFLALGGACTIPITPYQEAASGSDNEKFNADYGTGPAPVMTFEPAVTVDKTGSPAQGATGARVDYSISFVNTSPNADAGLFLSTGAAAPIGLVISDDVPTGMTYVAGSAAANNSVPVAYTIRYYDSSTSSWTTTEPAATNVRSIQWWLEAPLERAGSGSNSGTVTFAATLPGTAPTPPFVENCAEGSFADGEPFASSCTVTMIAGNNTIGNYVWWDANADGIQDGGETGIDDVLVSLYYDKNGDGLLDDGDVFIATQTTASGGAYSFGSLADGDFLVVVDDQDTDITDNRLVPTTRTVYAVTDLGISTTSPVTFNDADFGFGPVLAMTKSLTSSNPAYEGENVTWTIDLTNTRPGDGSGQGVACTYTGWGTNFDSNYTGVSGNREWFPYTAAFDGNFATFSASEFGNTAEDMGINSFSLGSPAGSATAIDVLLYIKVPVVNDFNTGETLVVDFMDTTGPTVLHTQTYNGTTMNTWGSTPFTLEYSLSASAVSNINMLDLDGTRYVVRLTANGAGGAQYTSYVDLAEVGLRVTSDQTCGGPADTITTLPLTDEFDPARFEFVSADPTPDSVTDDTAGSTYNPAGLLTWNNLGPLYAGQTKSVTVVLKALEPPDADSDSEADAVTTINYARVRNAEFANGSPVNDGNANDDVTINPTGSIGDTIWNDNGGSTGTANDGVQNGDEAGIPGVTVYLDRWNGTGWNAAVATTTTDENGQYLFDALRDGSYRVRVDTASLPGATFTQTGDPDDATPPCAGAECDHQTNTLVINTNDGSAANDSYLNADFGYRIPNSIYGNVWEDNDGDTTRESGENGISGVTVYLCNTTPCDSSNDSASTVTNANGDYQFSDLLDGTYYIGIETGSGPVAGNAGWGNTIDPEGAPGNSQANALNASGGNMYGSYDFGYAQTGASDIGDTLYADWNGDGDQDSDENGIPNITVWLYEDSNGDGILDPADDAPIATDTTDANGEYLFENLPAGSYLVIVDEQDLPWDYAQTQDPDEAGLCTTCDDQSTVSADGSSNYLAEDYGYQPIGYGSIGDYVWADSDGDGLQDASESPLANITVNLYVWNDDGDGILEDGERTFVATQDTDANGGYRFENLPAATYIVDVDESDAPAGTVVSSTYDHDDDLTTPNISNDTMRVTLDEGENFAQADFGFVTGGKIGDYIWEDIDGDGFWDTNEPGLQNVSVSLYNDVNGNGVYDTGDTQVGSSITTDSSGYYVFTGLPAGDYVVVVTTPAGYSLTGDPDAYGTTAACAYPPYNPAACTYTALDGEYATSLLGGRSDLTADFGYQPTTYVGDVIWLDADGDGVRDPDEQGISGVTVRLCEVSNCSSGTVRSTTTDENGEYSFGGNMTDGSVYYIVVTDAALLAAGLTQTYDPVSGNACNLTACTNAPSFDVDLDRTAGAVAEIGGNACAASTNCNLNLDFGYRFYGNNTINGTVWFDSNSDQTINPGPTPAEEPVRYGNVPVYLWNCGADTICGGANAADDVLVGSTLSAADGTYAFGNLADGTYRVIANSGAASLTGLSATTPTAYTGIALSGSTTATRNFGFVAQMDLGDLPAAYNNTLLADNGARHIIPASAAVYLGSTNLSGDSITPEGDGRESGTSDLDTYDDGVLRTSGVYWVDGEDGASVDVDVTNCASGCYLSAWVDWNEDEDFNDSGERVLLDYAINSDRTITLNVPAGFNGAQRIVNARFRLYAASTSGLAQPTGLASNGEVEDYQWIFGPTAIELVNLQATPIMSPALWLLIVALLGTTLGGALVYARYRK